MGKVMEKPVQDDESTEVALRRRGPRHDRQPATTKSTPSTNGTDADVHDSVKSSAGQEISIFINEGIESIDEIDGNVHSKILGSLLKGSSLPPSRMSSEKPIMPTDSTSQATTGNGNNSFIEDLYLETVYKNDVAHQFYCPNCNSCIQKVIICGNEPVSSHELFRCSSCFSFLIPIGNWFFPNSVSKDGDTPFEKGIESIDEIDGNVHSKILGSLMKGSSLPPSRMSSEKPIMPTDSTSQATTGNGNNSFIEDLYLETVYKNEVAHHFYCPNCNSCIQKVIIRGNEPVSNHELFRCSSCFSFLIPIGNWLFPNLVSKDDDTPLEKGSELRGSKKLEIVKSIVYGGLIESITSLSVVTSAASADAATLSIIALSLANLIGGIFTLAHSLSDLKSEQPREASSQTNEHVDRYQELLGRRENFLLHATIALLSFLVFGLVPPAVYGYTFMETDDKNLMLVAVSVSSLLCIATLAIGKAHIQKPPKNHFKIVLSYLVTGNMASGVSYVAGDLAKKLIEKLGWFEPGKAVLLPLAGMSSGRLSWASY